METMTTSIIFHFMVLFSFMVFVFYFVYFSLFCSKFNIRFFDSFLLLLKFDIIYVYSMHPQHVFYSFLCGF